MVPVVPAALRTERTVGGAMEFLAAIVLMAVWYAVIYALFLSDI
jgi:hypothetical protein